MTEDDIKASLVNNVAIKLNKFKDDKGKYYIEITLHWQNFLIDGEALDITDFIKEK